MHKNCKSVIANKVGHLEKDHIPIKDRWNDQVRPHKGEMNMAQITTKGKELARKLAPSVGLPYPYTAFLETCSLIARHTVTHHRLAEMYCNGPHFLDRRYFLDLPAKIQSEWIERWETRRKKRDEQIEKRITVLVSDLAKQSDLDISVRFEGDPRGSTVRLLVPANGYTKEIRL